MTATDAFTPVTFAGSYGKACVLADMNTFNGPDPASVRSQNRTTTGIELQVDEEQSADGETTHIAETLAVLVVDCGEPAPPATVVAGTVSGVTEAWQLVEIVTAFSDPVVVAGPASWEGHDPGVVEVRTVGASSFEVRFREWEYLDGAHVKPETVSFVVVERGVSALPSGALIEAGTATISGAAGVVPVSGGFGGVPVVVSTVLADAEPSPVVAPRLSDVSASGFTARLQEQESLAGSHGPEAVNWIAWSPGSDGGATDGFAWETQTVTATDAFTTVSFAGTYQQACVLADMNTFNGPDTATVRADNQSTTGIDLQVDEETSLDGETTHTTETLAVLVIDCG